MLEAAVDENEIDALERGVRGSEAALILFNSLQGLTLTDDSHTKIETLRELICDTHPDEKIVVFSRLADYIQPVLTKFFDDWGVSYVVYRGTDKQRLEAKDKFRNDPNIRVFLSSDAGSDSIDLPEASVAIDYDEPLKWATKIQRRNRIHRVNSTHGYVTFYTLRMVNSVEDRIAEIIHTKEGYHDAVFKRDINENAISARMTADDVWYILTGETMTEQH
jgi:SNF2 family DNA or RNA helicase